MRNCWNPVSKGVPAENRIYNITYESVGGQRHSDSAYYNIKKRTWYWDEDEENEVSVKL